MNKEKQIEEIAGICCDICEFESDGKCLNDHKLGGCCIATRTAKKLYREGYCKQSEGEWKKRGNEKTCSLCKFIYYSNNDNWNYCPNCGAKMKGE